MSTGWAWLHQTNGRAAQIQLPPPCHCICVHFLDMTKSWQNLCIDLLSIPRPPLHEKGNFIEVDCCPSCFENVDPSNTITSCSFNMFRNFGLDGFRYSYRCRKDKFPQLHVPCRDNTPNHKWALLLSYGTAETLKRVVCAQGVSGLAMFFVRESWTQWICKAVGLTSFA